MKRSYVIKGTISVPCYTLVVAEDPREAMKIARARAVAEIPRFDDADDRTHWLLQSGGRPSELHVED